MKKIDIPNGRLYITHYGEDMAETTFEMLKDYKDKLFGNSIPSEINQELEKRLKCEAQKIHKRTTRSIAAKPIPKLIFKLFDSKSQKEALKIARKLIFRREQLSSLITNAQKLGFKYSQQSHEHFSKLYKEFKATPKLEMSKPDIKALQKSFRTTVQVFNERKYQVIHLFERGNEWHIFYFDFNDLKKDNQFKGGSHIHYISSNTSNPRFNKDFYLKNLAQRKHISSPIHIRFVHGHDESDSLEKTYII